MKHNKDSRPKGTASRVETLRTVFPSGKITEDGNRKSVDHYSRPMRIG